MGAIFGLSLKRVMKVGVILGMSLGGDFVTQPQGVLTGGTLARPFAATGLIPLDSNGGFTGIVNIGRLLFQRGKSLFVSRMLQRLSSSEPILKSGNTR